MGLLKAFFIAVMILTTSFGVALAADETKTPPPIIFKGTLKTLVGHEGGYMRPQIGDAFELDFQAIEGMTMLNFPQKRYIPIPGELVIQQSGDNSFERWGFLRADAIGLRGSGMRLEAHRRPGMGDPDFVDIWILIEGLDGKISAFAQLEGKIYRK